MDLTNQKRIASDILGCSPSKIVFDESRLEDIKEAITKVDLRVLIKEGAVSRKQDKGISSSRSKKIKQQKRKGRQRGHGSRKGKSTARQKSKTTWIHTIRSQRDLLKTMREKELVTSQTYRQLYAKAKGGFFRSRRHLRLYIDEHDLINQKQKK